MKRIFLFILIVVAVPMISLAQFTTYTMGGVNSTEFTTNNFKCIGVGKGNRIWAGTQYGGLYTYDEGFNFWRKSSRLTNVFINDIKADPDSGIWIAQSGTTSMGGNSNIAGGINYFRVASDLSMEFYSVLGTTTTADLLSRNVRSLYIDTNYKAANGQLPRPWAAQGTFITSLNTKRGGLSIGVRPTGPFFTNIAEGFSSATASTPICEAIGGNRLEIWVAVRQNGPAGSQILRYTPMGNFIGFYDANQTTLPAGFSAQAIHFDRFGNKWVGLKAGGLAVKTNNGWVRMDNETVITPGAQINYNAITEDEFGNVYIGTSDGMVVYQSQDYNFSSSPDYPPAYIRYSTLNGLPNNNVTGMAYDKKNGRMLITTSGGVTFMNIREPFIKGVVFDVTCKPDAENAAPGFQKKPLTGGILTARLLKDGVEKDFDYPDLNGVFEFTRAIDDEVYTVEIEWKRNGRTIKYVYNNIINHTRMQPILIPEGLIDEIKTFKADMQKRCIPLKLSLGLEFSPGIFCVDGFPLGGYETPGEEFYRPGGLTSDIKKRVDNLGAYYLAMKAVYKMGGDANDLYSDLVANALDAVQSLQAFYTLGQSVKKNAKLPDDKLKRAGIEEEALVSGILGALKGIKEGVNHMLTKLSQKVKDPETKKKIDKAIGFSNDAADMCISLMAGKDELALNLFIDNLKKVVATAAVAAYYTNDYAGEQHGVFVPTARLSALLNQSTLPYEDVYDKVYSGVTNSLAKQSADTLANRKAIIEAAARTAKYAAAAGEVFDAGRTLALIPGAQFAAGVFTGLSIFSKTVSTFSYGVASLYGAIGSSEVESLSRKILNESQLQRPVNWSYQRSSVITQDPPTVLTTLKNDYNLKLTQLQNAYNLPVFDSATYRNSYYALLRADSLYSDELNRTLYKLAASNDSAVTYVAGYERKLDKVIDSFVSQQYTYRLSLFYRNLAYVYDSVKTNHRASLDTLTREIKRLNDSAVSGIAQLVTEINSNGIAAPPYLVADSVTILHSHLPGSAGTLRYYFTNYGAQTQTNVSFKMKGLTAGYRLTGADSIYVGNIPAGATRQVNFSFQSPIHDSVGLYQIAVKASNGAYRDLSGSFLIVDPAKYFTVKNGNWHDPATWDKGAVPTSANSVYISHTVTVTANASCKTVNVSKPGNVIVNAGNVLNVLR